MATNRIYSVYNTSDTNDIPIQKIANFIRYNVDGSQLMVEWIDSPPTGATTITHQQAVALSKTTAWSIPIDESND